MDADRAALLRAVLADPADDTARLVFADWLQEHGAEDRAAFIRFQIETFAPTCAEWPRDGGRMPFSEWPDAAAQIFAADLVAPERRRGLGFQWHRGWIDTVSLRPWLFLDRAAALFAIHPVERVTLAGVDPEPDPLDGEGAENDSCAHILVGVDTEYEGLFGPRVPLPIWFLLDGHTAEVRDDHGEWPHKTFATRERALESISRACVEWGRTEAGLPFWEPRGSFS